MYSAIAARGLAQQPLVFDPQAGCAAEGIAQPLTIAEWDDTDAVEAFARQCDAITLDREDVPLDTLRTCARFAPIAPSVEALEILQDRLTQKNWLRSNGLPTAEFHRVDPDVDPADAYAVVGAGGILKSRTGGYDGRGQMNLDTLQSLRDAIDEMNVPAILERRVPLQMELSVMVARNRRGESRVFPVAYNHHERSILAWSVTPAPISEALENRATEVGLAVADALGCPGLVAVELFVDDQGEVLVNEVAARPHNTFHATVRACVTSQFEQHVRAVADLPLGDVQLVRPTAIANVLGEDLEGGASALQRALAIPGVRMHWYGKSPVRPRRKMAHVSAVADSPAEAAHRVEQARAALAGRDEPIAMRDELGSWAGS